LSASNFAAKSDPASKSPASMLTSCLPSRALRDHWLRPVPPSERF
jgi:hypothetical protein